MSNLKIINKNIILILATGAKLDKLVHDTGVMCLSHAEEHGDARPMDSLLKALNKGYRAEGFKVWVQTFSPIRWNKEAEVKVMPKEQKGYVAYDVKMATKTPFWDLDGARERTAKELSFEAVLAMLSRMVKQADEADEVTGEVAGKDGEVRAKITDNVIPFRAGLHKLLEQAEEIKAEVAKDPNQVADKLIKAAARKAKAA